MSSNFVLSWSTDRKNKPALTTATVSQVFHHHHDDTDFLPSAALRPSHLEYLRQLGSESVICNNTTALATLLLYVLVLFRFSAYLRAWVYHHPFFLSFL